MSSSSKAIGSAGLAKVGGIGDFLDFLVDLDFSVDLVGLASLVGLAGCLGAKDYAILSSKWTIGFLERIDRRSEGSAMIYLI
jgi:hypothetical protein